MKQLTFIVASLSISLALLLTAVPVSAAAPSTDSNATAAQCLHYSGHIYEVCTAYIFNSSIGALEPYYKYSRGTSPWLTAVVSDHLAKRYVGSALQTATNRVANFPAGWYSVEGPHIAVLGVSSNLAANQAILRTSESWTVRSASGRIVYQEVNKPHTVVMQRVPSYILHKWVVSSF